MTTTTSTARHRAARLGLVAGALLLGAGCALIARADVGSVLALLAAPVLAVITGYGKSDAP
jgi:hypothetical protein